MQVGDFVKRKNDPQKFMIRGQIIEINTQTQKAKVDWNSKKWINIKSLLVWTGNEHKEFV